MNLNLHRVILAFSFLFSTPLLAQISINTLPYAASTTDFNSYNPSSSSNLNATIPSGWTAASSGTAAYRGQGTGTANSGGYWAYGSSGDFSVGALRSGTVGDITYSVAFLNNSGTTIGSLQFSWDYKQFRFANTSGWDCSGTGALASNATLDAKDFSGSSTGTNGTPVTTTVSPFTLTGLSIANSATFGISWTTTDDAGADNGVSIDNFKVRANNNPLPIRIARLELLAKRKAEVALSCTIESSEELQSVVLERSADGLSFNPLNVFEDINSRNFSRKMVDSRPLVGVAVYRVKMLDLAGNVNYSAPQVIQTNTDNDALVRIAPNPCHDAIQLYRANTGQATEFVLFNALGQELRKFSTESAQFTVDMRELPAGQYFLQVRQGELTQRYSVLRM
ncbi:MAG: T9SS type A sorting domain-containing protein [Bacteroidetes bacterium]|nr:T9SS type A sorting domain-containing protein [Bacteroidota bacterium]